MNRQMVTAGAAALAVCCAALWYWGFGREAILPPGQSAALERVRDVSLREARRTGRVAPAFVDRLDVDLSSFSPEDRKSAFFRLIMPLVARENDRIRSERRTLLDKPAGVPKSLYERYRVEPGDTETLRRRVDIIPASLVLAQAAVESGWGTSRFALQGNNLFGMRSYDKGSDGLEPQAAKGFKVMRFDTLGQGVAAYMRNLNSHEAYRGFREARAALRRADKAVTGTALTGLLTSYSEIPEKYGDMLRTLIAAERLHHFDEIRLADRR
jgi:Bax protein